MKGGDGQDSTDSDNIVCDFTYHWCSRSKARARLILYVALFWDAMPWAILVNHVLGSPL